MKNNKGFTLIEIIVFITVFAVFFVTAAYVVTVSLRILKFNQDKLVASHLASELNEWVRGEKEVDWSSFANTKASQVGTTWCFKTSPITAWPSLASSCSVAEQYVLLGQFKREVKLTTNSASAPTQVTSQITVSWREGDRVFSTPLTNVLSVFE